MIKDNLINANNYYYISERLQKGFEWLKNNNLTKLSDGMYEIDGKQIYANIQTYKTKEDALYEAHKEYIDIQYMIKGQEKIGFANLKECTAESAYDEDKDIMFLTCNNNIERFETLSDGEFIVFFPVDAHKPSLSIDKQETVKKVVVKVKV